ncbi:MAG: alcohol dehydrogenase catalytic domain-containing protein [Planctomycetota bacterium]|jgi:threonine dehydrogenase-like Zn-dependent dehydrogenase|nr:alcohol dehydrogenase catalytic domain-containing protein [Planctomycetota bacterium]
MRGAFYTGEKLLEIRETPTPEPGPGQILIKVDIACVCGTDLHIVAGEYFSRPPVIIGHEFAGVVAGLGEGATAAKVGDLVTVEPHQYCRVCKFCKTGREHLCLDKRGYGTYYNGGFAEYAAVAENTVYPAPAGIGAREAALAEVLGCCIRGVDRSGMRIGDTVAVLGCSSVGMIFTKLARRAGAARIIVSEPNGERRRAALGYGADLAVDPGLLKETLDRETGGLGPDVVIECSGVPAAAGQAVALAGRGARVVLFGVAPPGETVSIEPNGIFMKELAIVGSTINPFTHYRAVEMLPSLGLGDLITHVFPLARINEAMEAARRGAGLKIAIEPNG